MNDDKNVPSVELLKALFDVLSRAGNDEQRARLLACCAIAMNVDEAVVRKLNTSTFGSLLGSSRGRL